MRIASAILGSLLGLGLLSLASCHAGDGPQVGSQTNWLKICETPVDCDGEFDCICGTCTKSCESAAACGDMQGATCVAQSEPGSIAICDGQQPDAGMCLSTCDDEHCEAGSVCMAGVCVQQRDASVMVSLDPSKRYQSLIGFGASLAYGEERIVNHPEKDQILDAMFTESGFEMIRFRNLFDADVESDFSATAEIIAEAESRLGMPPKLYITSGSPPAALKANGDTYCASADVDCTLARDGGGAFDYAAFAEHWRASLEAYEAAGIHPDFVSIQNNVDFVPSDGIAIEACRLIPAEGTISVRIPDGTMVDAEFAGYSEASAAVRAAVSSLPDEYSFTGPEVGSVVMVERYIESVEQAESISYHPYGTKLDEAGIAQLENLERIGNDTEKPLIQSEMSANGMDTAMLTQLNLIRGGASAYLQGAFVGNTLDEDSASLIGTDATTFRKLPAYHALSHFARSTGPGWTRVDTNHGESDVLSSAWISPSEDALTVIFVNPGNVAIDVGLSLPAGIAQLLNNARVTRTVFDGEERSQDLGEFPRERVVRLPAHSIITIAGNAD